MSFDDPFDSLEDLEDEDGERGFSKTFYPEWFNFCNVNQ